MKIARGERRQQFYYTAQAIFSPNERKHQSFKQNSSSNHHYYMNIQQTTKLVKYLQSKSPLGGHPMLI